MRSIGKNIFYTLLFALAMEFQINVLLQGNIFAMIGILVLYSGIAILTYFTFPFIIRRFSKQSHGFWVALSIHALAGLFVIEWGFMGNTYFKVAAQGQALMAIFFQCGMLAWWGGMAALPYILQDQNGIKLKRSILVYYSIYAIVSTILTIPFGMIPVILIEPPVFLGFIYFYKKFLRIETLPISTL